MTDEISRNFDLTHERIQNLLSEYICGGYVKTLAQLLIYMDKTKALELMTKIPEPLKSQLEESYDKLADKKNTDPEIIAAALRILKDNDFYGETICELITKDLNMVQKEELLLSTDELFEKDPLISIAVEENIRTFDTILELDNRAIQKLLRESDQVTVAKALKNCSDVIKEKIFSNMSKRAATMLKEDMEFMGPVLISDIKAAQEEMVRTMVKLEESGDIVISEFGL